MYRSRLLLLAALVLGASLMLMQVASADMNEKPDENCMLFVDKLTKELNLTPDQVTKIEALHKGMQAERKAVLADQSLTREQRRAKLMDLHRSKHEQVLAVLTPEQRTKFEEWAQKHKAEWKDRMSQLNLTPEQEAKIKAIRESNRTELEALKADKALSAEARKSKMREIFTATRDEIREVLTPEQREKLDAIRERKAK